MTKGIFLLIFLIIISILILVFLLAGDITKKSIIKKNYVIKKVRILGPLIVGIIKKEDIYKLELKSLKLLHKNYNNYFKKYNLNINYPFPVIYKYNKNYFKLSNNGKSINKLRNKVIVYNYKLQLKNIIYNLKKNNIKYLDMTPCGKNLVVNKKGIISLIDFNLVQINNFPSTLILNKKGKNFTYEKLYKSMENILKKNRYIILK